MATGYKDNVRLLTVVDTINNILLQEYKSIVYDCQGSNFAKFILIAVGIEYLGACLDEFPFTERSKSENRFNQALVKLFSKRYHQYAKGASSAYLYEKFRCGIVHQLRPAKGVAFSHRDEAKREKTSHLSYVKNAPFVLVLEDFYDDFEMACIKLVRMIESGKLTNKKVEEDYLRLTNVRDNEI